MSEYIKCEKAGPITWLRLARPAKRNAINGDMYRALAAAIEAADADETTRVIVLTGTDDAFCSGKDLAAPAPAKSEQPPVNRFLAALTGCTTPVIAGVSGPAVGIGMTMLLHCDIVVASTTAVFRLPFVSLGLVPEAASSLLLPRMVGHQRAAELFLTGRAIEPDEAERLGLVNRVVPVNDLMATVRALAEQLADQPYEALRATKALLRSTTQTVSARISEETEAFALRAASQESREAIATFMQRKRSPSAVLPGPTPTAESLA